jgi:hypothetical protein
MTIGAQATLRFFMRRKNHKARPVSRCCLSFQQGYVQRPGIAAPGSQLPTGVQTPPLANGGVLRGWQGSAIFFSGFGLVVWGWSIVGFILETYGFWLLFSGFFPTALSFLRRVPFLGKILDAPFLKTVSAQAEVGHCSAVKSQVQCCLCRGMRLCLKVCMVEMQCTFRARSYERLAAHDLASVGAAHQQGRSSTVLASVKVWQDAVARRDLARALGV